MVDLNTLLSTTFFNNTGKDYLIAFIIFIAFFIVFKLFDYAIISFFKKYSKRTKTEWDDIIIDFIDAIHWQFYIYLSFYIGTLFLQLPDIVNRVLGFLLIIFIAFYTAQGFSRIVDHFTNSQIEKRKKSDSIQNTSMIRVFGLLFKGAIYTIMILMILANFGIEITPLIASLGIGGVAIAIALQSVLADLFAAFAIYFDKPFKEGDFIIIGDDLGTVKHIGIKTTRIATLQGQELIVSNSELTNTRVNNYKKMDERRIVFTLGVEYSTSTEKLKKINNIIKKSIETTKKARLDRTHFKAFGDSSLNFEVVYYVTSPDYNVYMDVQEEINFKIQEAFEKEKIVFAFPTQTIHLKN